MDSLVHPSQLSVWHRFLQARRLHRETNRSKNVDWYRPALQLDAQLHLFQEGDEITDAHLCSQQASKTKWTKLPTPKLSLEEDAEEDQALLDYVSVIRRDHLAGKARSLGVVLHLADEFAISELSSASERPEDLSVLSQQLIENPQEVIEDHSASAEEISHRLFPYPGARPGQQFGAAISLSTKHQEYLRKFRAIGESLNFPILTTALSAPLVALSALPRLAAELPNQPFCVFFSYSTFSVLAFFSAEGDLVMLRSVRHHAGGTPPHVGRIIQTMAAALELPEPLVFVLPLSQGRQGEIVAGLPELPNASILDWRESGGFDPEVPLEFQGTLAHPQTSAEITGLAASETFRDLTDRNWSTQDFLPPSKDERELYPSALEMKALRFGGVGLRVGAGVLAIFLALTGVRAFKVLSDDAWHETGATPGEGNKVLSTQIRRFEHWNSFLADRSKAWVNMELMNQLFPNPSHVVLTEGSHTVRPEVTRENVNASLVKEWRMNGYVNDSALEQLTALNTREGITRIFTSTYQLTGDESLRTDLESRNLVVNLVASENKRYNPDSGETLESQFPFIFSLTISQRISADDPIAIPTVAAP